ncbi:PEP-CTERM sorting domain-containing protein [Pontiella sulfatireligans]|uniref:PEP-CTERM protein-sorting domain-containing protein n=1 Tax=Pontiella sulfatireligans TaxID=2750658 RepID=A0A6C2UQ82_9BACT|nr:PEP-CTERM sorting domain-containing protein [Pontiella sulfatireligans]VGO22445.1 hypothetical protein SCARR_04528 [Pontiella sulfatireligans]
MKKMKHRVAMAAIMTFVCSSVVHATIIYQNDFVSAPTMIAANAAVFDGTAGAALEVGEFAIAANSANYNFGSGEMAYTNDANASGGARARTIGVAIDISGADQNQFEVSFDITQFGIPNVTDDDQVNFGAWHFSGVSSGNGVSVDMQKNAVDFDPDFTPAGIAGATQLLGGNQQLTATGAFSDTFTLGSVGAGDYIFIAWTSTSDDTEAPSTQLPKFAVDNIVLETIPEPATLGLIAAFGGGIMFIRRRFMM